MSDQPGQQSDETKELKAEADAARARIAGRVERLQERLEPKRLVREAVGEASTAARAEGLRTARMVRDEVADVADEAAEWVRENRVLVGSLAAAAGAVVAYSLWERRREERGDLVPIYDAYAMEDPVMVDETTYADARPGRLERARDTVGSLAERAGERYQSARHAASERYHAARDAAGERYHAARDTAGERWDELSETARERYREAADWTRRQPSENPMGTVVAGFALGALLGALLPRTRAEDRAMGPAKQKLTQQAKEQAQAAVDAGKAKLAEAGITPDAAKAKLGELADQAKHVAKDVAGAAVDQVKTGAQGQPGGMAGGQQSSGLNPGYSSGAAALGTSPSTPSM